MLNVEHVSKSYANHRALDDVSLRVASGTIYGLLGPNGAGKTTLIRIINHITAPDSGTVTFDGHPLTAEDVNHIGYLPEERGLYKKMKVGEQALFFARLKGLSRGDAERELRTWFERFDISSWWNRKVEELSKGMAQKVQFIVTVLHRPKLLIFDEPFSGFDPVNANLLKEEILRMKREGATIIFSTHNMASVEELCDNITLIDHGREVLSGNVDEIRRRYRHGRYVIEVKNDGTQAPGEKVTSLILPYAQINNVSAAPYDRTRYELLMHEDRDIHALLSELLSHPEIELTAFNEALASMNDIFINAVTNKK